MFYKVILNKDNYICEVNAVMANTEKEAIEKAKYRLAKNSSEDKHDITEVEKAVENIKVVNCKLLFQ